MGLSTREGSLTFMHREKVVFEESIFWQQELQKECEGFRQLDQYKRQDKWKEVKEKGTFLLA